MFFWRDRFQQPLDSFFGHPVNLRFLFRISGKIRVKNPSFFYPPILLHIVNLRNRDGSTLKLGLYHRLGYDRPAIAFEGSFEPGVRIFHLWSRFRLFNKVQDGTPEL